MPYAFFLSYAHDNRTQDGVLDRFFTDLSTEVSQRLGVPIAEAGFIDREGLRTGVEWSPALVEALQSSSVFVSLTSPHYVASAFCGKEFHTFLERRNRYVQAIPGASFRFVSVKLSPDPLPMFARNRTFLDFSSYPDGPNGGELLRLLYAISGMPLSPEAARFASEQDEAAQQAAAAIGAAVRNGAADRLVQLFEAGGLAWQTSSTLGCKTVDGLIRLGRYDDAVQIVGRVGDQFPRAIRPKQLQALALMRRGAARDLASAQDVLGLLYERGERDPETVNLYARTWADRFYQTEDVNDLRQSRDLYVEAANASPGDYYSALRVALRVASTSVLLGTDSIAHDYARHAQKILGTESRKGDYWGTAAVAETWLIQGDYQRAARTYDAALAMARSEAGSQMATWKQVCRLLSVLRPREVDRARIRSVFAHLPDC